MNYGGTKNSTYLFRSRTGATLSLDQIGRYDPVQALPYDRFVRVTLEIDPKTPTGSIVLYYDTRKVYEDRAAPFDPPATTPRTEVYVGLVRFDPPAPALDVRFDNVRIGAL